MKRYALPLALLFILIGAARIASTYRQVSVTTDEPYHFSCGLDYLALNKLCVVENPLLQPIAAAVLPYLDGTRPDTAIEARQHEFTYRDRSDIARQELQNIVLRSADPWRAIVLMRTGVLPFFIAASLVVFFAARRWFGDPAAVLATAIFTLIPTVLAHAGLATTDISATATVGAAFFVLAWWNESPTWTRSVWLGIAAGLMLFSKFSGAGFLVLAAILGIVFHVLVHRPAARELLGKARERLPGLALAIPLAALLLGAGFHFSPRLFATFRELMAHARAGHGSYLLGEFGNTGWWYYYPVGLAVKTPLAILLLLPAGVLACWERRRRSGLLPIAFVLGVLLTALPSPINLGIRHVLPIYVGLSIVAALGAIRLARVSVCIPAALVLWLAISGIHAHPDYLSYFNKIAADRPDDFLLDSDLDWDQDWALAGRYLRERGASEVTIDLGRIGPFHSPEIFRRLDGLPPVHEVSLEEAGAIPPQPGWHIISATRLRISPARGKFRETIRDLPANMFGANGPWYGRLRPVERIGGLYLFHVPAGFR